ncbi:MAG: dethiobiotin synthase [Kiritimatiellae bacterium]|nr:dethiobiotin synthase [Kiritimatiellia bacterium]
MFSLLITATDTGVGKTVVTAAMVAEARKRGRDAVPMKPSQTGCVWADGRWVAPDLEFCYEMSGYRPPQAELGLACPFPFMPACAPHLAASMAGRRVSLASIAYRHRRLCAAHELVAVEGIGGVRVPLNIQDTMLDLMAALRLPVLLVVRTGLGTLNHTLMSLDVLRAAEIPLLGLVAVRQVTGPMTALEQDNLEFMERRGHVPILACLERHEALARGEMTPQEFRSKVAPALSPALDALDDFMEQGPVARQDF